MLVKDRKFLIGLKIFASIALCCTIVLWGAPLDCVGNARQRKR